MKNNKARRTAAVLSSLVLLMALGACSSQVDEMGPAPSGQSRAQASYQGTPGTPDASSAPALENNTAVMGAAPADAADDPDARVAIAVKSSLAADPDFTALKIDVHSEDGVVTLIGRAPDPAARERAAQIARNVREVRSVENLLTLG